MNCVICGDKFTPTAVSDDVCITCFYEEDAEYLKKRKRVTYELKHALANALNMVKGFDVGYTSLTNEAIVIEHKGETFFLRFEHKENLTLEGAVDELWQ